MLSYLRSAFSRRGNAQSEATRQQQSTTRSSVRLCLESLEDRLALSTVGGVDPAVVMQALPTLANLEQQFIQQYAQGVAGLLTTEAQFVSSFSPPLASLLQNEAQFVLSLVSSPAASNSATTGIHEFPVPPGNIFPPPVTAAANSIANGIHEYPIPPGNIFPPPWTGTLPGLANGINGSPIPPGNIFPFPF